MYVCGSVINSCVLCMSIILYKSGDKTVCCVAVYVSISLSVVHSQS